MNVTGRINEINITDGKLHVAVFVDCDEYDLHVHSPKVSLVFETKKDMRRIPLPVEFYEPAETGCRIFGSYNYVLENLFWNIAWKECRMSVTVEYGTERYDRIPIMQDCRIPEDPGYKVQILEDQVRIFLAQKIDSRRPKNPSFLQVILATLDHGITGILGIFLLPWFVIDSLGIMLLHTETENPTIEGSFLKRFITYVGWRYFGFCRNTQGIRGAKSALFKSSFFFYNRIYRKKKKLLFLSNRREDLTGNFQYVYDYIKDKEPCLFWLESGDIRDLPILKVIRAGQYIAEAKVILVDDYIPFLNEINIDPKTKMIQLWHACGAFKTFGFSRLKKIGGPKQDNISHRYYDYVIVSSSRIVPYYAEGFGVSEDKVLPLGVPRTDVFFDKQYAEDVRGKLYQEHPELEGKKIILFAPTFRGNGKLSAYYDKNKFNPNRVIESLPEDTVIIIKHHPFVVMKYDIEDKYKDRIFDFSEGSEINDLLFITDVLITDYSSVIFEASLLNIPMLFYAYDEREYIASRDIYSEYDMFVPGKIVHTQNQLIDALKNVKPDQDKMDAFKKDNFEYLDGKSTQRVAKKIMSLMQQKG